ncbi:hypothetical protein H6CHR_01738 [Variovorax sp. PBL-H6]|uniref:hypothetical protein n=1 Tax=Variovorax sp. PBL-H6 TaxID=434009 RepID=UPI0013176F78|nr:hypothetical protein [Variovorax sp. PBL-H6]VTU22182.1 hypothetical protein H6CHR_01738 [Variovorax sp. PBL-H6]
MALTCGACHTLNRDAAIYCRGCASKLSAASCDPGARDALTRRRQLPQAPQRPRPEGLGLVMVAKRLDPPALWVSLLLLLWSAAFVLWHVSRTHAQHAVPARPIALAVVQAQAEPLIPAAGMQAPPRRDAVGITIAAEPAKRTNDVPLETVEKFYRALSVADGHAAAALVTPAKRGAGAFDPARMSSFYGSLRQPLVLRSVRRLDGGRIEARYSYKATVARCEATAIVETERVRGAAVIRSIHANC